MSFLNLATNRAARGVGKDRNSALPAGDFTWVGDQRVLLFDWGSGWTAVNCDQSGLVRVGTASQSSSGAAAYLYASAKNPERALVAKFPYVDQKYSKYPDIEALNTLTGDIKPVLKNPGNFTEWMADKEGNVRLGISRKGATKKLWYRDTADQPWGELDGLDQEVCLFHFHASGQAIFLTQPNAAGRWALYAYELKERRLSEPLFQHETYDIACEYRSWYAGEALAGPIFSKRGALLGVKYVTEKPQQKWFGPLLEAVQLKIDEQFPATINRVVSMDYEENRLLILSWSDQNPGFYSMLDLAARKIVPLGQCMPWIKPEQMAPTLPITCTTRDGLKLHGYLTVPSGQPQKNLPMVMLVHDGPQQRDVWGFNPQVQFLANRGYVVLQINYRGSTGYGREFFEKGQREIGGAMQDDITDAVRWAIQEGIADPKRIAIMGSGYGGYSTLFALAKTPDLYRCGVAVSGVMDWTDLLEHPDDHGHYEAAKDYWSDLRASLKLDEDRERLARVSPINFANEIKAPLMMVHGGLDDVVPFAQAKAMAEALGKAGHPPETMFESFARHGWPANDHGKDFLKRLEAFLAKNLAAR